MISTLGMWLINKFISDQAAKEQALKDFAAAIQAHADAAQTSVNDRIAYQKQLDALAAQQAADDAKAKAVPVVMPGPVAVLPGMKKDATQPAPTTNVVKPPVIQPPQRTAMPAPTATPYHLKIWDLWRACSILVGRESELSGIIDTIVANWSHYLAVEKQTGVPVRVVAWLHYRESEFNFRTYLANGDPLFAADGTPIKTVHVPAGTGPFPNWETAAVAALKGFDSRYHWDLVDALENGEAYNGEGYHHRGINDPYVWAGTNQEQPGLYESDGNFNPDKVDGRFGGAAIMLGLKARGYDIGEVAPV